MEEYIREAPKIASASSKSLEYDDKNLLTYKEEEEQAHEENEKPAAAAAAAEEEDKEVLPEVEDPPELVSEAEPEATTTADLLGLDEVNPVAAEIEQTNALALAIIQPGDESKPSTTGDLIGSGSGWELALVTTPSSNTSHVIESKLVALKTLIVIHRTLREGDPTFREELCNYSHRGHILQIPNFKDDSSPLAWDCSGWVRRYALFLEERLECFRIFKYEVEAERLMKNPQGAAKGHSRTRTLCCPDLLEQLPALQQLLFCLVDCQPEGGACGNYLVQYTLAMVLKESFKIYCAINDGIINLVDMYFEMSKFDAVKALEIYKRAGQQVQRRGS